MMNFVDLKSINTLEKSDCITETIEFFGGRDSIIDNDIKVEKLKGQGFSPKGHDGEGILIFGLNPSGSIEETKKESNGNFRYFNYIMNNPYPNIKKRTNCNYFNPIKKTCEKIIGGEKTKWDWVNNYTNENELDGDLKKEEATSGFRYTSEEKQKIKDYYNKCKDKQYTIFIGDLFYLHETKSNKLKKWINNSIKDNKNKINDYINDMLVKHIFALCKNNIKLKFIYINNSLASDYICKALELGDNNSSVVVLKYNDNQIPMFFGGMLSGQHAMDKYSKARLINEVKEVCKKINI